MNIERIQLKGQLAEAKSKYKHLDTEAAGLVLLLRSLLNPYEDDTTKLDIEKASVQFQRLQEIVIELRNLKQKIEAYPNIKYLGFVDDPVLEISKCQALIAPLHKGAGVKVKVIDTLTSGTNVIGTNVAFEGIEDNINNKLFILAEKNDEYINAINNCKKYTVKQKQDAATEFFDKYNKNHSTDLLK